jgi:glutathione S-transferase
MIPGTALDRAELRRLVAWLDEKLYADLVAPLIEERMRKRPGQPRAARHAHPARGDEGGQMPTSTISIICSTTALAGGTGADPGGPGRRGAFVGRRLSGRRDWRGHKQTVDWYGVMKSRPSFRPCSPSGWR